jgi:hypothetical protein
MIYTHMSLEINWKKSLYISHMQTNHIQILVIASNYISQMNV